ncbi:MAG: MBL fold metallo-hydrolase [Oscillospiraceae bacterium]|nr:MBL fold metallo-hydrolase [Oscillospiraceae bacterium]
MRKKITSLFLLVVTLIILCSCSQKKESTTEIGRDSYFRIYFLDVGQGDAAVVECDGQYMLIDGGDTFAEDTVYDFLVSKGISKLEILAISHLHKDHIGGLPKVLTYATKISHTICNADFASTKAFTDFEKELLLNGASIEIPKTSQIPGEGQTYFLGSATVEVVYASAEHENDSLVLLITYGDTRFLFTGDIEDAAQTWISDKYQSDNDEPYKIDLIKMPHHGSYSRTLYRFLRTFMPDYAIISVGQNNYGHPHQETLDLLDSKTYNPKVYRTDLDGDIIVKSDGKSVTIED